MTTTTPAPASKRPVTPGYTMHVEIAFTADRHGNPIAYRWSVGARRWIRVSYGEAKVYIAAGLATEVPFAKF
jgi:hypothetical protein